MGLNTYGPWSKLLIGSVFDNSSYKHVPIHVYILHQVLSFLKKSCYNLVEKQSTCLKCPRHATGKAGDHPQVAGERPPELEPYRSHLHLRIDVVINMNQYSLTLIAILNIDLGIDDVQYTYIYVYPIDLLLESLSKVHVLLGDAETLPLILV